MSNPYQSPQNSAFDAKYFQDAPQMPQGGGEYGWIQQVRVYAILSAVQAVLELPLGMMLLGVGGMFPVLLEMEKNNPNRVGQPPPAEMGTIFMAVYMTLGGCLCLVSLLRLVAAYQNFYFRGRTLGLVSMGVGLASMLTCYCAPTSIAVLVYGLVLFLNPAVRAAFEMGAAGRTPAEIFAAFMPYRPYVPPQPPAS